jgi:hypothetical protein
MDDLNVEVKTQAHDNSEYCSLGFANLGFVDTGLDALQRSFSIIPAGNVPQRR